GKAYQINYLRCIFCVMCIEACPTGALTMTIEWELAGTTRAVIHITEDQLVALLREGTHADPHPMAEGITDKDCYRGDVTGPTTEQVEWVRENRPEDETLEAAEKAASRADATSGGTR